MLSFHSSILCSCELELFSGFLFWPKRKAEILRRKNFYWGAVNNWQQHVLRSVITAAAGNTGKPPDSASNFPLDWDPFEDFFGLGVDLRSRKGTSPEQQTQKYERDGPSIKEMPCPTCKGQGYSLCPHCNSTNLEASCPHCSGRGYYPCPQCHGQLVILQDSLNESTWANLHPRSPLQIADDEAIESMTNSLAPKRKTRRVYGSPLPETRIKISRALKDLEARTGSISQRLKDQHRDPILRAQRTAAIKKARGTDEARKRTSEKLKEYFKSPENRLKRSQSMIGVHFTCTACGQKGHRRHFCPKLGFQSKKSRPVRSYHCSNCGKIGHRCTQCSEKPKLDSPLPVITRGELENAEQGGRRSYRCGICHTLGHTKRTCPNLNKAKRRCSICGQSGHNKQTCSMATAQNQDDKVLNCLELLSQGY